MGLSVEEVQKLLLASIEKGEHLTVNELRDIAEKSDDYNLMILNNLYATMLEEPQAPLPKQIADEIMQRIKECGTKANQSIDEKSVMLPIYGRYELLTEDIAHEALKILFGKQYLENRFVKNQEITFLTPKGAAVI